VDSDDERARIGTGLTIAHAFRAGLGFESLPAGDASGAGQPALILEFIDGESLGDHMRQMSGARDGAPRVRGPLRIALESGQSLADWAT
jgi:hypothetical protein